MVWGLSFSLDCTFPRGLFSTNFVYVKKGGRFFRRLYERTSFSRRLYDTGFSFWATDSHGLMRTFFLGHGRMRTFFLATDLQGLIRTSLF